MSSERNDRQIQNGRWSTSELPSNTVQPGRLRSDEFGRKHLMANNWFQTIELSGESVADESDEVKVLSALCDDLKAKIKLFSGRKCSWCNSPRSPNSAANSGAVVEIETLYRNYQYVTVDKYTMWPTPQEVTFDAIGYNYMKNDVLVSTRNGCRLIDIIEDDLQPIGSSDIELVRRNDYIRFCQKKLHLTAISSFGFRIGGSVCISSGIYLNVFGGYDGRNPKACKISSESYVAVDRENIYVSALEEHHQFILAMDKECQELCKVRMEAKCEIRQPGLICITRDGKKLYVEDKSENPTKIVSYEITDRGRKLRKDGQVAKGLNVAAITCDRYGYVFVCHYVSTDNLYAINVYAPNGELVRKIKLKKEMFDGKVDPITGISVTNRHNIIVCHEHALYVMRPRKRDTE